MLIYFCPNIIHAYMYMCTYTAKQLSLAENFKELEKYVEGVSNPDSKTCMLKCFTNDIAIDAIKYLCQSLFQHYRLYEYLFTEQQQEETIFMRVRVVVQ